MSLLMNYSDSRFTKIAQYVFEEQFRQDPKLETELDERRKRLMYDDVIYNISYLMTAVRFRDSKIFEGYAVWIYELLCNLMKDRDRDRIMEYMNDHYRILGEALKAEKSGLMSPEEISLSVKYLNRAIEVTSEAVTRIPHSPSFIEGPHYEIRKAYLDALLTNQTKKASDIIRGARNQGTPLTQIYEHVLTKVLYEIGELWHKSIITIDKEHYATSVTQTVMAGFYEEIFNRPGKNRTLISCAVGSELHEIGIRMLTDIFEQHGWDTYYLGAALPESALMDAVDTYHPDLIALSVTMPPYLSICEQMVQLLQEHHPDIKIAVGGLAFRNTDKLWEKWGVDFYATTAEELFQKVNHSFLP